MTRRSQLRFLLLQARRPDDQVRLEEVTAFATQLGVEEHQITPLDMLAERPHMELLGSFDAVLVGGSGHYSVLDDEPGIRHCIEFLGEVSRAGFPTFASCFGFQAMVLALGGEIIHDEERAEVGTFAITCTPEAEEDPLFSGLPARFMAQEGHKDRASTLPPGVTNLARSERVPFQAFRVGDAPVYATQFHPELSQADQRLRYSRYLREYGVLFGEERALEILEEISPSPESNALLRRFTDLLAGREA